MRRWELLGQKYRLGNCRWCGLFAALKKITVNGKSIYLCKYCEQSLRTGRAHKRLEQHILNKKLKRLGLPTLRWLG